MGDGINQSQQPTKTEDDFLLKFYKENPDALFKIGEWETEIVCAHCRGSIEKSANCLFNQEFPTENTSRRNLAQADARCPHCLVTGETQTVSDAKSIFTPIPTDTVWFRKLTIDPPLKKIKTLLGYKEEPQEQRYVKEYRQ